MANGLLIKVLDEISLRRAMHRCLMLHHNANLSALSSEQIRELLDLLREQQEEIVEGFLFIKRLLYEVDEKIEW